MKLRIKAITRQLMDEYPNLYWVQPEAYRNKEKLILHVQTIMRQTVAPESVLRAQRRIWAEEKKKNLYTSEYSNVTIRMVQHGI